MATALNWTLPLKQDAETQQKLRQLIASFAPTIQPLVDAALARSEIVHFARIVLIGNQYVQVLTEFDGDPMLYTEFFRKDLGPVFQAFLDLVEGAPSWEQLNNPDSFFEFTRTHNLPSLGVATDGTEGRGYMFSAYGDLTVREIHAALPQAAPDQP